MSLKLLIASVLGVLSSSSPLPQCEQGGCASPADNSFPQDETSLLQVKSAVTHGAMANGTAFAMLAEETEPTPWLKAAINFLDNHINADGLWRKQGLKKGGDELEAAWKSGDFTMATMDFAGPYTVTLVVGRLLKKDPLLSEYLSEALAGLRIADTDMALCFINMLISEPAPKGMTPQKFVDFKLLLGHWNQVTEHEAVNQMNVNTMATCAFPLIVETITQKAMMKVLMEPGRGKFVNNLGIMIGNPDGVLSGVHECA